MIPEARGSFWLSSVWASEPKHLRGRVGGGGDLFSRSSAAAATFSTIVEPGGEQVGKIHAE